MTASSQPLPIPHRCWLAYRGLVITGTALAHLVPATLAGFAIAVVRGPGAGRRHAYRSFARLLQRLGPTFVKFGQIMSTRRDAVPAPLCEELAVLYDAVEPMTPSQVHQALAAAYGGDQDVLFRQGDFRVVASGSVASVVRARLHDGREVALKLQRPGIARLMVADLALVERLVRLCERLPKCRGMPVGDLTTYVSAAILGQLDFQREAASLVRLRRGLAAIPGVRVPAVVPELSRRSCLAMEFLHGLDAGNLQRQRPETRRRLAATLLQAAHQMIFVDGYVHCDLHPGNLYVNPDRELVILDAGFSVQLPDRVRSKIAEFFRRLSQGNGRRCAAIIIESAAVVRPGVDRQGFVDSVAALIDAKAGTQGPAFAMMPFGNALFDRQREFGLYAESDFVFPLMSLAIIESTARVLHPGLDFREIGEIGQLEDVRPAAGAVVGDHRPTGG